MSGQEVLGVCESTRVPYASQVPRNAPVTLSPYTACALSHFQSPLGHTLAKYRKSHSASAIRDVSTAQGILAHLRRRCLQSARP